MTSDPCATGDWQIVSPLELPDWDRQLATFRAAGVFHGCGWARTLVQAYGHRPVYSVFRAATGFHAVLPLMEVCGPFGRRQGISLPFTDSCPPLISGNHPLSLTAMVDAALAQGRAAGWRTIELRCPSAELRPQSSVAYFAHELALVPAEHALFKRCDPSVRRAIRRAREGGLRVEFASGVDAVRDYYELHCLTRKRLGSPPQAWRFFHSLARNLVDGQGGFVARVRLNARTIAAAVFLLHGRRALYKFGASDFRHQHLRTNNLVMWESIRRLAESGFTTLDFGRTSLGNEGLRRFKLGWGTSESSLFYFRIRVSDGAVLPIADKSRGWHTGIFRRLPVPVLKWIGRALYRFQS